jgi:hypothetical protein
LHYGQETARWAHSPGLNPCEVCVCRIRDYLLQDMHERHTMRGSVSSRPNTWVLKILDTWAAYLKALDIWAEGLKVPATCTEGLQTPATCSEGLKTSDTWAADLKTLGHVQRGSPNPGHVRRGSQNPRQEPAEASPGRAYHGKGAENTQKRLLWGTPGGRATAQVSLCCLRSCIFPSRSPGNPVPSFQTTLRNQEGP